MRFYFSARTRLGLALLLTTVVSLVLFGIGMVRNNSTEFGYFIWNLFLAWLPLLFALWLGNTLRRKLWSSWEAMGVTLLWLVFLPNAFYIVTDLIHIRELHRVDFLLDVIMFASFVFNGLLLGYIALYGIHQELIKRVSNRMAATLIGGVLLLCSFAIYLGRELRWNTWDLLVNPGGILVDISDRFLYPANYPSAFEVTGGFFVLLGSMYVVLWQMARYLRHQRS